MRRTTGDAVVQKAARLLKLLLASRPAAKDACMLDAGVHTLIAIMEGASRAAATRKEAGKALVALAFEFTAAQTAVVEEGGVASLGRVFPEYFAAAAEMDGAVMAAQLRLDAFVRVGAVGLAEEHRTEIVFRLRQTLYHAHTARREALNTSLLLAVCHGVLGAA